MTARCPGTRLCRSVPARRGLVSGERLVKDRPRMTPASDRRRTVSVPLTSVKTGILRSLADSNSGSQSRPQAHIGTQPR